MSCWLIAFALALAGQLGERYVGQTDGNSEQPFALAADEETLTTDSLEDRSGAGGSALEEPQEKTAPAEQPSDRSSPADSQTAPPTESGSASAADLAAASTSHTDPETLLKTCSEPPLGGAVGGTSLSLTQALAGAASRAEQTERVEAYWKLVLAVVQYYVAQDEETEFAALHQAVARPSELWNQASQELQARKELDWAKVQLCQRKLASLLGNQGSDFSPVPADVPFCGAYSTKYEEIFQNRPSPLAEKYSQYIPRSFDELGRCADQVALTKKWVYATSLRRSPQSDGTELLLAFEAYANSRRQFLQMVADYNLQIVNYTELASPQALESGRLVAMLIRNPVTSTLDPNVRSANSEQESGSSQRPDPPTQLPGSSNWSVPSGVERSILVPGRS